MAYFSKLNGNKQLELYKALQEKVSSEANAMYNANGKKAGCYKDAWFELLDDWMQDKVSNLHIMDCLKAGYVLYNID